MPVNFSGFSRVLTAKGLKPGRWFTAGASGGAQLCMLTGVGSEGQALVLTFSLGRIDTIEFKSVKLMSLAGPLCTVEDEVLFEPGEGLENLRLMTANKKPFPSGSLLRLANGDMGVGFAEKLNGELVTVSMTTGLACEGFDLVFDRWSLSLSRAGRRALVGHFKGGVWRD